MSERSHWNRYHEHWRRLRPPLRPAPPVVAALEALTRGRSRCALLGVTPELASLGEDLTAIDRDSNMIAALWPGDLPTRRAVVGDWLNFPATLNQLAAVVGDGALNVLPGADTHRALLTELHRVLAPGGRAALRVFARPTEGEAVKAVVEDAGQSVSFHGFKWRIAMAICSERRNMSLPVRDLLATFRAHSTDSAAWMASQGWPLGELATIDIYEGSAEVYSFPTRVELAECLPVGLTLRWLDVPGYELSECCPLAIFDKHLESDETRRALSWTAGRDTVR